MGSFLQRVTGAVSILWRNTTKKIAFAVEERIPPVGLSMVYPQPEQNF
jgi:hypothetical protein